MSGVCSDPEIRNAYEDVRNNNSETNWFLMTYNASNALEVSAKGTGGLEEFKTHLVDNVPAFGFLRIAVGNDELSVRAKFVLVSWCPPTVPPLKRGRVTASLSDVKNVIEAFAIEVAASSLSDLQADEITKRLKVAMGANYDRQASAY